ncbi:PQQ-binding-like beta-propeller repeat protein [Halolamina sediminis]|uniref:PQQ-binding-like beta-propeller repeat protein n=1 Tax=Halolamina sediminis TaxID=1480675 RepID=UPI0006B4EE27|nr:PQQ-binding-like beta-propeller repeat protein [Halolamina sediminis]
MLPSTDSPIDRRAALATGVAAASSLAGCTSVRELRRLYDDPHTHHSDAALGDPPEPWPTLGHDSRRTGARETAPAIGDEPTVERVGAGGGEFRDNAPAVTTEAVYATTVSYGENDRTRGFAATGRDGEPWWDRQWANDDPPAPPTIQGETALLSRAGRTVAVDRRTGEVRWEYAAGNADGAPTAVGETVFLPGRRLLALDGVTGERRWAADDLPNPPGPVAATDSTVFAESDGTLSAVDAADGSVRWEESVPEPSYDAPVVGDAVVAMMGSEGLLQAIPRTDEAERWQRQVPGGQVAPSIADGRVLAVSDTNDSLLAFDARTGETDWTTDLGPTVDTRVAVGGETAFVMGYDESVEEDSLFCIDTTSGTVRRTVSLRTAADEPLATEGTGVALADDGVLFPAGVDGEYGIYRLG